MLLHLSDLHFGTEREECIQAIRLFCQQKGPEAIVISGDLTQRARFKQFYDCRQFLDSLHIPYLVVRVIMIFRFIMSGIASSLHLYVTKHFLAV